jgi:hypothetical protein
MTCVFHAITNKLIAFYWWIMDPLVRKYNVKNKEFTGLEIYVIGK